MSLAERRHNARRVKNKFIRKQKLHPIGATTEKTAGIYANHGSVEVGCRCCTNARHHHGVTMQEKRVAPDHVGLKIQDHRAEYALANAS